MPTSSLAPMLTRAYLKTVWATLPPHLRPPLLLPAPTLSARLGCTLTLASETFQYTGSFKFRAAYHLLSSIPHQEVIATSSGNFGQAVAYASSLLGKTCTVVMPASSSLVKMAAVRRYGGSVDLIETSTISRVERVRQHVQAHPGAFAAQPADDPRMVAGNSTLGQDLFRAGAWDLLVVPIGGGGLAAGQILARDLLNVSTAVLGAEPQLANDAARSLNAGHLQKNAQEPSTVADGARTLQLGQLPWGILHRGIEDILEVPEVLILGAVRLAFALNLKVEPTGALALGALLAHPARFVGKRVCCVLSGGNVDPEVYAQMLQEEKESAVASFPEVARL